MFSAYDSSRPGQVPALSILSLLALSVLFPFGRGRRFHKAEVIARLARLP